MKIGRYTIREWNSNRREVYIGRIYFGDIHIAYKSLCNPIYVLSFNFHVLEKEYIAIYGSSDNILFDNLEVGKKHVDEFLNKLKSLKAFM